MQVPVRREVYHTSATVSGVRREESAEDYVPREWHRAE
jgi:hypothetical protein